MFSIILAIRRLTTTTIPALSVAIFCCQCTSTLKKPFLWSAKKDGHTSYLMGTQHEGVPYTELPDVVLRKLDESAILYVERDVAKDAKDISLIRDMFLVSSFAKSTDRELSAKTWSFVINKLGNKFSVVQLSHFTTYALYTMITQLPEYLTYVRASTAQDWNMGWSMDSYFVKRARNAKKRIRTLDGSEIYATFDDCWKGAFKDGLDRLARGDRSSGNFDWESTAYRLGDEAKLAEEVANESPEMSACVLFARNKIWLPKIEKAIASHSSAFIAMGAAHLIYGEENILSLLRQRGYEIERIAPE